MRIIGGKHKGLALVGPKSSAVRPTSDRMREALFNVLTHGVDGFGLEGIRVLDLFAGTGALGLETLSRGARFCLFIDEAAASRAMIRRNVEAMDVMGCSRIWRRDATRLGRVRNMPKFDLLLADPPYGKRLGERAIASALADDWLADRAVCVLEETVRSKIDVIEGLMELDRRTHGDTQFIIYRRVSH